MTMNMDFKKELTRIKDYEGDMLRLEGLDVGLQAEKPLKQSDISIGFIYSGDFGARVIDHLVNSYGHCGACGHSCIDYKCKYGKFDFSSSMAFAFEVPQADQLPLVIDNPWDYLPRSIPKVDVVVASGLHNDLYLGLPELLRKFDVRALIVLRDHPDDMPLGVFKQVADACNEYGIEVEAPKPSCSLIPKGKLLNTFVKTLRIGRPVVSLHVVRIGESLTIRRAKIHVSAPCGMTWYVLKNLIGYELKSLNPQELRAFYDKISLLHHSYPCTGSMNYDRELGDTILHWASYIDRESIISALGLSRELEEVVEERLKPKH